MAQERFPRKAFNYAPKDKHDHERPTLWWLDRSMWLKQASMPNPFDMLLLLLLMMMMMNKIIIKQAFHI